MAYQKQTWVDYPDTSSPLTAERLNHMEDGIEEAWNHGGGGGAGETLPIGSELDFDGLVSDIPDGWEQVQSSWTKLGSTITGSTSIDISSIDYRELYIRVLLKTSSSDGGISLEFYIIKDVLTSTNASFRKGYFDTTTTCGSAYVNASTSSISLNYGTRNGSNCTSTSTIDVYYK